MKKSIGTLDSKFTKDLKLMQLLVLTLYYLLREQEVIIEQSGQNFFIYYKNVFITRKMRSGRGKNFKLVT